jgi:hypothetical protein
MPNSIADRNLLFGILALQMDFISRDALVHADAAQKYYEQMASIAQQLAVAPELMFAQSNYGRSFYALGLMRRNLGKNDEPRANFEKSRHVREQLLRDFGKSEFQPMLQIDLLFSLVALCEHVQAVSEADKLQAGPLFLRTPGASGTLYRLACIYSLSADAVEMARAPAALTVEDKKLQVAYKDKALTALEQSDALGNRDFAHTKVDADLIAIRADPRFAKILELEKKPPK